MKKIMQKTETYELNDMCILDVVTSSTEYNSFLAYKNGGIKIHVLKSFKDKMNKDIFLVASMNEASLMIPELDWLYDKYSECPIEIDRTKIL